MIRKRVAFLIPLLVLLLFLAACERQASGPEAEEAVLPKGTSLLLVTLDTTRRDFLSPYGADPALTPNLSRFARQGTTFLNAYAQTNVTNPSHITILTGLRAADHGIFNNQTPLTKELDTLAHAFQRAGYETAAFPSVQHLGQDLEWSGFDRFETVHPELNAWQVTGRILRWLRERRADRPFFAWLHYWDPHAPYTPPKEIQKAFYSGDAYAGEQRLADHPYFRLAANGSALARWIGDRRDPAYPKAMYAGEVHFVDREFGRLLKFLKKNRLARKTAILVISDHGESLMEHGIYFSHSGLYETQLRIPFLARIPGFPGGLRPEDVVTHVDVAPTVEELFGVRLRHRPRGVSLVSLLRGETPDGFPGRDSLIHESAHNKQVAKRRATWKLIWPVRRQQKFLPEHPELFDLKSDPDELRNLAAEHPDVVEELKKPLRPWFTSRLGRRKGKVDAERLERLKALGYVE